MSAGERYTLGVLGLESIGAQISIPDNPMVYRVTTLDDSGPGSLRGATSLRGDSPIMIVFDVAGYIDLYDPLTFVRGDVFVLGETAPVPGITLRKALDKADALADHGGLIKLGGMLDDWVDVGNVVVRNIRFRHGDGPDHNSAGLVIHGGHDILMDNCTFTWNTGNLVTGWLAKGDPFIERITFRRCLFAEPLANGHDSGPAIHGDFDVDIGDRTYLRVKDILFDRCLFASYGNRAPMLRTGGAVVKNCVMYNQDYRDIQVNAGDVDFVGNYWKAGPQAPLSVWKSLYAANGWTWIHQAGQGENYPLSIYVQGNTHEGLDVDERTLWGYWIDVFHDDRLDESYFRDAPLWDYDIQPPEDVFGDVLGNVGAQPNDTIDLRIIGDVINDTGFAIPPETMEDLGGWL